MTPGRIIAALVGVALLGGGLWWALARPGTAPRPAEPVPSDDVACGQGEMAACDRLGLCKRSGSCRQRRDGRAAAELFRRACQGGWAPACYHLGHCYGAYPYCGIGVDVAKAAALYQQACAGGYLHGCTFHALTYAAPLGSPHHLDANVFQTYVERACQGGDQLGCAHRYEPGLRHPSAPDHAAALAMEAKACAAGVDHACLLLARCHDTTNGEDCGLPKDDTRALAYYDKACRGGDASACVRLIACYDRPACSLPVPEGQQQGFLALHRRACESKGGVLAPDGRCTSADVSASDAGPAWPVGAPASSGR